MKSLRVIRLKDGSSFILEHSELKSKPQEQSNLLSILALGLPTVLFLIDYIGR